MKWSAGKTITVIFQLVAVWLTVWLFLQAEIWPHPLTNPQALGFDIGSLLIPLGLFWLAVRRLNRELQNKLVTTACVTGCLAMSYRFSDFKGKEIMFVFFGGLTTLLSAVAAFRSRKRVQND
jgi:hypothetical protein